VLLLSSLTLAAGLGDRLIPGATVVWAGLDYSTAEMFVPETFNDPAEKVFWGPGGGLSDRITKFASPDLAWTQLVTDWNTMYVNEGLKRFEKDMTVDLVVELPAPDGQTNPRTSQWFRPEQTASVAPSVFDAAAVAARVATWKLTSTSGTGLGVIVDRLSNAEDRACAWPVYFDVATREVLWTERLCSHPVGIGFRNYWFNPINDVMEQVTKKTRKRR
jgi:hypothetical protein